jgi:hypothetical protein
MELERSSTDALEQQLIADERLVARLRARQMAVLEELDVRQVATGDGARSLSEWVSGRLDVGPETAKTLVRTMRRLQDRPDLSDDLASGRVSFDRIEAVSRIHADDAGLLEWADVSGVRREAAKRARVTAEEEYRSGRRPVPGHAAVNLERDARWKLWGVNWTRTRESIVDKVLTEASDRLSETFPTGPRATQAMAASYRIGGVFDL